MVKQSVILLYILQNHLSMELTHDVHRQFAAYFPDKGIQPFIYLLSKKLSEGHICVDYNNIQLNEISETGYVFNKEHLSTSEMVSRGEKKTPLILVNDKLYFQRYFEYETIILNRISELIKGEDSETQIYPAIKEHASFIMSLFNLPNNNGETNWQLVAGISAVLNNFTIITGGPGTGKTTTVAKILAILYAIQPDLKVALTAPTGKAATRMAESLKNTSIVDDQTKNKFQRMEPSTIHRLLGTSRNSIHFKHNHQNPLPFDLIVTDESSMIDVALFAKFLDAVGPGTKVILLGDKDQLASVEAGSMFGDLCQAMKTLNQFSEERADFINQFVNSPLEKIKTTAISNSDHPLFQHIIELQKSHRFSDEKGIGKLSKAVINNDVEIIGQFFQNNDEQVYFDKNFSHALFEQFVSAYEEYITEDDIATAIKKLNTLRVLCAVKEGDQGLYTINKKIEKILQDKKLISITGLFYHNRPVMVTNNNKDLQLFNGDIGIIRLDKDNVLKAYFEDGSGKIRSVIPGYLANAETVFAMTIHKSQGSEFDKVMVILPKGEAGPILTRELLYTAVTRAKNNVIIQGNEETILQCSNAAIKRGSGIISRFNQPQ